MLDQLTWEISIVFSPNIQSTTSGTFLIAPEYGEVTVPVCHLPCNTGPRLEFREPVA